MSRTKHNPPQKPEPNFIKFGKVQQGFIAEIMKRQRREFGEALESVYEELGILEKVLQAPPGTYKLRQDYSGVDILPIIAPKVKEKVEPEKPTPPEEPAPQGTSKEKSGKDN